MADKQRRDRGAGSYRQRPGGTWQGQYQGRFVSAKTEAEVKRLLRNLVQEVEKERDAGLVKKNILFSDWLNTWLEDYKKMSLKASTYSAYTTSIEVHIKPELGKHELSKITPDHIQTLYRKMTKAGAKPATVVKAKNIINSALEQAVKNRYIMYNPTRATKPPKIERDEVRVFTPEEQARFMDVLQGHRLEAFYLTALGTGMRRGELLALTWDGIDFKKREISVVGSVNRVMDVTAEGKTALVLSTPKTRSGRRKVPMIGNIETILLEHQARQSEEKAQAGSAWNANNLVFCSTVGTYLEPRRVAAYLNEFLEQAGLEHINFHALRHTFATRMLEHGASLKALQEILGHADAALTLNTYAHIVGSAAHDEIQKIDSLFNLTEKSETEKPKHRQVFQPHNTRKKGARTSDIIGR